ncbi:TadE/TadG family type IV pilus assembly protein [Streptomyces sp. 5.8]|uniref:TadE/TadG family type IV pilus assembly protein n=1 Tax=Streptomyces sp. 5.8 TaxID=3406571 RepID=UPI003BB5FB50
MRDDKGDASLEMLMCFPAALLLVFLVVDTCNIYFAKTAATTAAREAVAGARGYGSTSGQGIARADAVFRRVGDTLLTPQVSANSSAERIEFTVTGRAQSALGLTITVTGRASGPVERWSNP